MCGTIIKIYTLDISSINLTLYKELAKLVSIQRKNKANRFHNLKDSIHCVCGELLLLYILGTEYSYSKFDLHYSYNQYGKPYLTEYPKCFFNISHSGKWIVCSIGDDEMGIDIEKCDESNLEIAKKYFTQRECKKIFSKLYQDQVKTFTTYWTLKESYLKCKGCGLQFPLNHFEVCDYQIIIAGKREPYSLWEIDFDLDYSLSICTVQAKNMARPSLHFIDIQTIYVALLETWRSEAKW